LAAGVSEHLLPSMSCFSGRVNRTLRVLLLVKVFSSDSALGAQTNSAPG
jgi:hypothetical protein